MDSNSTAAAAPSRWGNLGADLPASFVVFLVAVPLSLGIALASNAPIMAGLIAAAVGGIVVGLVGGAPLQVSGPAAGLTVLVFGLTEKTGGDWPAVCAIVVMAGLCQIGLGLSRVARTALAMSPAVVHGMLAGIGIIIALGQLHVVLGGAPQSSAMANLRDLPAQLSTLHGGATTLGILTIALVVLWQTKAPKALQRVPAALVGVGLVTLLSLTSLGDGVERIVLAADDHVHAVVDGHQLADGPEAPKGDQGSILAAIQLPVWPDMPWTTLLGCVFALTMIASVESLLCAVATDKLHTGKRGNLDRELVGQGLGNTVSGLLGGLPVTGVIVRSSANIAAGGKTQLSAILHGVWVIVFVVALPFVVESIPKAVLAGLLVFVGYKLVNIHHIRDLREHKELPVYVTTVLGVVCIDLLMGVVIGFGLAVARLLWRLTHFSVRVEEGPTWRVHVKGSLSFIGVPKLSDALGRVPPGTPVHVDLELTSIDHAAWEALDGWRSNHARGGGKVQIDGLDEAWTAAHHPPGTILPGAAAPATPTSAEAAAALAPDAEPVLAEGREGVPEAFEDEEALAAASSGHGRI